MQLIGNDYYMLSSEKSLNSEQMNSLMNMYMPLVSPLAMCLYMALLQQPLTTQSYDTHLHLCERLQCTITQLEEARLELEHFLLLKSYVKEVTDKNLYIYDVQYPLYISEFLRHFTFARLLLNKVGTDYIERYSNDVTMIQDIEECQEITSQMKISITDWNSEKEEFIRQNIDNLPSDKKDPYADYDMITYLRKVDPNEFTIQRSKLTQNDIEYIDLLGAQYQINKEEMVKILHKTINRTSGKLEKEKFATQCISHSPILNKRQANYSMEPIEYATCLLEAPLKSEEVKAIRTIQNDYKFDNPTMNYIIECSINRTTSHRVVPNYLLTFAKNLTSQKQIEEKVTKKKSSKSYRRVESIPSYEIEESVDEVDLNELQSKLEQIKKKRVM